MNEFIEQFVIESREHVEQATADLLALEKTPEDRERLDSAFRAFHTLKGGAGIVEFAAMAEAVHAAEDALSAVRSGEHVITRSLVGDCLTCLDQVVQWLDATESGGALPRHAEGEARAIVARFGHSASQVFQTASPKPGSSRDLWAEALRTKHPTLGAGAQTAIRYTPEAHCFYEGRDPVALMAALPGLLTLDVEPALPWPPLDELDPFVCNVVLSALTSGSRPEVVAALGDAMDECDIETLAVDAAPKNELVLLPQAREILEEQLLLLADTGAQGGAGRMVSAGIVAANVLRTAGHAAYAERVARTAEATLAKNEPHLLREAIQTLLKGAPTTVAVPGPTSGDAQVTARTLRVEAARIDELVNLTGELTVAKNAIGHAAKLAQEGKHALASILKDRYATLDRLVGELQRSVLGLRVFPLRQVFQRFPRMLREMSSELGKPASLVVEGAETEADKVIVEMLFEPLLHVLRNAIDHGIESASTRAARGKPAVASIHLRAGRQGEHVVVEVTDDGGGIDLAKVRQMALERDAAPGLIHAPISDEEAINLIFEPGFSTAGKVTGLSGRGVGMDAVRAAVERIGGRVSVESRSGHGTTVRFTLPFSVMMTKVMVVGAEQQTFGIPLDAVVETLRIDADRIVPVGAAHAIVLRNRTVPLISLASALGVDRDDHAATEATVVITKVNGQYGALRVDRIGEGMEVMLKPLDGLLAGMPGLAGSTLLGDGSVLLILDLGELFQ